MILNSAVLSKLEKRSKEIVSIAKINHRSLLLFATIMGNPMRKSFRALSKSSKGALSLIS